MSSPPTEGGYGQSGGGYGGSYGTPAGRTTGATRTPASKPGKLVYFLCALAIILTNSQVQRELENFKKTLPLRDNNVGMKT